MAHLVPDNIEQLVPYPPGKPMDEVRRELGVADCIKLASNENPIGPSPKAVAAIREAAAGLHVYPDGGGYYLKSALSERFGFDREQIMIGNGSNELLDLLIRTFMAHPGSNAVTSEATFIVYKLGTQACGKTLREAPLGADYGYDLRAMAELVDPDTRLIFIANPNNPTGTYVSHDALTTFLAAVDEKSAGDPPILVLDEAYCEYADADDYADGLALVRSRPRTVVLRTFSKAYGLAGARCGYGFATEDLVSYVNRVRQPFNVSSLAQAGALAALGDDAFLSEVVETNRAQMARLVVELERRGMRCVPSQANFVLFDTGAEAAWLYQSLMKQGVIVRPMAGYGLPTTIRVTVGTPPHNDRFLASLDRSLADR